MTRLVWSVPHRRAAIAPLPTLVQQRPVRAMLFVAVAVGHIAVEYGVQAVQRLVRAARSG